jgi:hypothetical protein
MAAVTFAGATWVTTGGNATVVATPAVGDLIIVIAAATGGGPTAVVDNQTPAGVYDKISSDFTGFSTAGILNAWVRTQKITAASSTTWTATETSSTGGGLCVLRISGLSVVGLGAIRGAGGQSTGTAGTTPTPILLKRSGITYAGALAALAGNIVIGAVANGATAASMTPRGTPVYTEDFDNGYSIPSTGLEVMHIVTGETASSIAWGSTSATQFASIALEVQTGPYIADWLGYNLDDPGATITRMAVQNISSYW